VQGIQHEANLGKKGKTHDDKLKAPEAAAHKRYNRLEADKSAIMAQNESEIKHP
jgi:cell division protein FtsB